MKVLFGMEVKAKLDAERAEVCTPSKIYSGCFKSESLCRWQSSVYQRGFRSVNLIETIYGWSVRSDTGLDNFALLASSRQGDVDGSRSDAERWAREWQAESPETRYVWEY